MAGGIALELGELEKQLHDNPTRFAEIMRRARDLEAQLTQQQQLEDNANVEQPRLEEAAEIVDLEAPEFSPDAFPEASPEASPGVFTDASGADSDAIDIEVEDEEEDEEEGEMWDLGPEEEQSAQTALFSQALSSADAALAALKEFPGLVVIDDDEEYGHSSVSGQCRKSNGIADASAGHFASLRAARSKEASDEEPPNDAPPETPAASAAPFEVAPAPASPPRLQVEDHLRVLVNKCMLLPKQRQLVQATPVAKHVAGRRFPPKAAPKALFAEASASASAAASASAEGQEGDAKRRKVVLRTAEECDTERIVNPFSVPSSSSSASVLFANRAAAPAATFPRPRSLHLPTTTPLKSPQKLPTSSSTGSSIFSGRPAPTTPRQPPGAKATTWAVPAAAAPGGSSRAVLTPNSQFVGAAPVWRGFEGLASWQGFEGQATTPPAALADPEPRRVAGLRGMQAGPPAKANDAASVASPASADAASASAAIGSAASGSATPRPTGAAKLLGINPGPPNAFTQRAHAVIAKGQAAMAKAKAKAFAAGAKAPSPNGKTPDWQRNHQFHRPGNMAPRVQGAGGPVAAIVAKPPLPSGPPPGHLVAAAQKQQQLQQQLKVGPQAALDIEGRPYDLNIIVVNFANVGSTYGERVMKRSHGSGPPMFDYEGVRRCVRHLTGSLHLKVVGVVYENKWALDGTTQVQKVPMDIQRMCEVSGGSIELTPRVTGQQHKSADDEMTIKCAYNRNCRFMDNDNYNDWRRGMHLDNVRNWLECCQEFLQMRYYFDSGLGTFDTLDGNLPPAMLANGAAAKGAQRRC